MKDEFSIKTFDDCHRVAIMSSNSRCIISVGYDYDDAVRLFERENHREGYDFYVEDGRFMSKSGENIEVIPMTYDGEDLFDCGDEDKLILHVNTVNGLDLKYLDIR